MIGFRSTTLCNKEILSKFANKDNSKVVLSGWVSFLRKQRNFFFVGIRDRFGSLQVVLNNDLLRESETLKLEDVITVTGFLKERQPSPNASSTINVVSLELEATHVKIENHAKHLLPIPLNAPEQQNPQQRDISLAARYLDLRMRPHLHRNLQIRSRANLEMRNVLSNIGFTEVETPTLFKSTPEGAKEFLVPMSLTNNSSTPKFFALIQSPQQYKQMLMVGGMDRYFQFARCYRDEGGRADRQPEFTQLDLEMAFVNSCQQVQQAVEEVVCAGWNAAFLFNPSLVPSPPSKRPFFELAASQAWEEYGSDKPNISFGMKIHDNAVVAPLLNTVLTKKEKSMLFNEIIALSSFTPQDIEFVGDDVRIQGRSSVSLGKARMVLFAWMNRKSVPLPPGLLSAHTPFWVTNFRLFELNDEGKVECVHHPFTAPHPEDAEKLTLLLQELRKFPDNDELKSQLLSIRALHYDLVCNGVELGGGSIRIHNAELQASVLRDALGIYDFDVKFNHLLDALACGAPPHGGFALGYDRFVAFLCQASSLSDTLAFPKSSTGTDPLTGGPCPLPEKEESAILARFGLKKM